MQKIDWSVKRQRWFLDTDQGVLMFLSDHRVFLEEQDEQDALKFEGSERTEYNFRSDHQWYCFSKQCSGAAVYKPNNPWQMALIVPGQFAALITFVHDSDVRK